MAATDLSFFDRVHIVVMQIPLGRVAYYGQIAEILDAPGAARTVGWALASLTPAQAKVVPWQRVINKSGRCSIRSMEHTVQEQQTLLEEEGVVFSEQGYTSFSIFGWEGLMPDEVRILLNTMQPPER